MRIGVDLGGTKIEGLALDEGGQELIRRRVSTPREDYEGTVEAIVEHVDCDEQQLALSECNSGTWVFDAARVLPLLSELPRSAKGEYYLTDVVAILRERGELVAGSLAGEDEAQGINTPEQLEALERELGR